MKIEREVKHGDTPYVDRYNTNFHGDPYVLVYLKPAEFEALRGRSARVTIEPIANQRDRQIEAARRVVYEARESGEAVVIGVCLDTLAERIVDVVQGVKP